MADEVKITPFDDDGTMLDLLTKYGLAEGTTFARATSDPEGTWWLVVAVRPDGTVLEDSTGEVPATVRDQFRDLVVKAHQEADALTDLHAQLSSPDEPRIYRQGVTLPIVADEDAGAGGLPVDEVAGWIDRIDPQRPSPDEPAPGR